MIAPADLDRLISIAHEELMRFFLPDCCVLATRIMVDVCKRLGVPCLPLSIMAAIYTGEMEQHVTEHGCDFWHCREKLDVQGPCVLLGMPPDQRGPDPGPSEKFGAHVGVICRITEGYVLVDLSVEQASHPELGILLDGPLCLPVNEPFIGGAAEIVAGAEGITIRYIAFPRDLWYTVDSPDWHGDTFLHREIVDTIISRYNGGSGRYSIQTLITTAAAGRI